MRYFKVAMQSATHGIVYQRDFQADKIFRELVYTYVSSLIVANDLVERSDVFVSNLKRVGIQKTDLYKAFIVPHYGQFRPLLREPDVPDREAVERNSWISVYSKDPFRSQVPIGFFSIYVTIPKRSLWYFANFHVSDLTDFWRTIRSSLYSLKVLRLGERYEGILYARDDDQANFERDELFTQEEEEEESSHIEVLLTHASEPLFLKRSLSDFQVQETWTVELGAPDQLPKQGGASTSQILIARPVLEQLRVMARAQVPVEQGGVLVGDIYENSVDSGYIVVITDYIEAEDAHANKVEFKYTFESWQRQTTILQESFPGKRIIGWYHTHLVQREIGSLEGAHMSYFTPFFLSQSDLFTHRQFFRAKWYVALVLDTTGNGMFFNWRGDDIVTQRRYYLLDSLSDTKKQVEDVEE